MKIDKKKVDLIRAKKCLSAKDMRKAGLTDCNMNSIYNEKPMLPETVGKIARVLGVDVEEIIAQ